MPSVEIEYRVRKDGITLHIINASSRQEIRRIDLSKKGALELQAMLTKLIPLISDAKEQKAAPQI